MKNFIFPREWTKLSFWKFRRKKILSSWLLLHAAKTSLKKAEIQLRLLMVDFAKVEMNKGEKLDLNIKGYQE